jgi:translation initiation factor 1
MSEEICSVCGLPNELCVCGDVEKESSHVSIKVERRKYGKYWAVIDGFDSSTDLKSLLKIIKSKMATNGTVKNGSIEILFGKTDKTKEVIDALISEGYSKDSIHIKSN